MYRNHCTAKRKSHADIYSVCERLKYSSSDHTAQQAGKQKSPSCWTLGIKVPALCRFLSGKAWISLLWHRYAALGFPWKSVGIQPEKNWKQVAPIQVHTCSQQCYSQSLKSRNNSDVHPWMKRETECGSPINGRFFTNINKKGWSTGTHYNIAGPR